LGDLQDVFKQPKYILLFSNHENLCASPKSLSKGATVWTHPFK